MFIKKGQPVVSLSAMSFFIVALASIPLLFVLYHTLLLSAEQWQNLWSTRLPGLLANTLNLSLLVGFACLLIGLPSAYILARRQFFGKTLAVWLMILPLAIPTYVFAHIYTWMFDRHGWLGQLWQSLSPQSGPVDIYNIFGVATVLAMATYSYVFLLAYGSLQRTNQSLEEASRLQGYNKLQTFIHVTLPMLRPALAASLAVVVIHVLSDFGAVSMLRFQTFTLAIYSQMSGRFDNAGAAGLSIVLVFLSLTFFTLERFFRKRQRYYAASTARIFRPKRASIGETLLIWLWLGIITLFTLIIPLAWMVHWSWESLLSGNLQSGFYTYVWNSIMVAVIAGLVAILAAFPVAFYNVRKQSMLSRSFIHLSSVGFVLPGPVIALGILTFAITLFPDLFATSAIALLIMALVIRFLPLAIQSQDASLQQLTPSIEQAGRIFGAGPLENFWRIILPVIRGGMSTAFVLVFIDVLKELPATLLLRPTGFDTLPVRIWIEASEEMLEHAAPAALMLVLATLPALWIMIRDRRT